MVLPLVGSWCRLSAYLLTAASGSQVATASCLLALSCFCRQGASNLISAVWQHLGHSCGFLLSLLNSQAMRPLQKS